MRFISIKRLRRRRALLATSAFAAGALLSGLSLTAGGAAAKRNSISTTDVASVLAAHYGVLSDKTAISETPVPATVTSRPEFQAAVQRLGLDVSAARMAQGPDGFQEWLVPGTNGFCFVGMLDGPDSAFTGCDQSIPANGVLGVDDRTSSGYIDAGLVPDGNTTVSFTMAAGSAVTVPVAHNAYLVRSQEPLSVMHSNGLTGAGMSEDAAPSQSP